MICTKELLQPPDTTTTYYNLYSNSNRLLNTSSTDSDTTQVYLYDDSENGYLVEDKNRNLEYRYNYNGMMDSLFHTDVGGDLDGKVDTLVYAYNYANQRVMKLRKYWYMGECGAIPPGTGPIRFQEESGGGGDSTPQCPRQGYAATFYIWSGGQIIEEYDINDTLYVQYFYAGSRRVGSKYTPFTDSTLDDIYHYDAAGNLRLTLLGERLDYDVWGSVMRVSGAAYAEFTYTGSQWDSENAVDLFYLKNRYYDPSIGRFTTPDPLTSDLNPYSYARNNPAMLSDREGLFPPLPNENDLIYNPDWNIVVTGVGVPRHQYNSPFPFTEIHVGSGGGAFGGRNSGNPNLIARNLPDPNAQANDFTVGDYLRLMNALGGGRQAPNPAANGLRFMFGVEGEAVADVGVQGSIGYVIDFTDILASGYTWSGGVSFGESIGAFPYLGGSLSPIQGESNQVDLNTAALSVTSSINEDLSGTSVLIGFGVGEGTSWGPNSMHVFSLRDLGMSYWSLYVVTRFLLLFFP